MDDTGNDSEDENVILEDKDSEIPEDLIDVCDENELRTYEAARTIQQQRLHEFQETQKLLANADNEGQEDEIDQRLAYLMKQSEIFSHFMVGDVGNSHTNSSVPKGRKRKAGTENDTVASSAKKTSHVIHGRRQKSEEEEDLEMLKAAQSKGVTTWLNTQPLCIVGGKMRPYQLEGLNWLIRLHDNNINGILADEMGLGKTLQIISLLGYLKEHRGISGPHLIISPKSTISGWMRESQRWCPSLRVVRLLGSKQERIDICKQQLIPGQFDVVVASNESAMREFRNLKRFKWRYVIIDEAHRIKNENASMSKMVRLLVTDFKMLITGTPLQNNLHELWALLNFLLPEVFNSSILFDSWFNTADQIATKNVIQRLHTVLKPFMLRRVKADVERDLPPKKETKLFVGMTELQRVWYRQVLAKDISMLNTSAATTDRVRLLNVLMQLRKVCNHPYLFDGAEDGPPYVDGPHIWQNSGKMLVLSKLLPKLLAQGSRVLIFSQMTRMLDIIEDYIRLCDYQYCRIDGSTDSEDRDEAMDSFNKKGSEKFCFLLSTRAGGLGINLQTADTVIIYDSDWNPQVDLQAMDRAHRIGQTKEVRVFRLVTEKSVEEKVVERADRKLFLDAAVIQQGRLAEKHSQLSKAELMAMVRFGADEILNSKDGMITDEDIDNLLRRGEERTQEDSDKLKTEMQHNLAHFSIAMDDTIELNLLAQSSDEFAITSGAKRKSGAVSPTSFIALPQRERKKTIDVNSYFKEVLSGAQSQFGKDTKPLKKKKGIFSRPDYQLFDKPFFEAYGNQLEALSHQKHRVQEAIKTLLAKDSKSRRQSNKRIAVAASTTTSGMEVDGHPVSVAAMTTDNGDSEPSTEMSEFAIEAAQLTQELQEGAYDMPIEVVEEHQRKLNEGFKDWSRTDFKYFCDALERFGRNRDRVALLVAEDSRRHPVETCARYYDLFMTRYETIADWQKIMERADKGDKKALREQEMAKALQKKVSKHPNPWISFPISYQGTKGKLFSFENDIFIVLALHQYGYGCWEKLSHEIRMSPKFRFDWFIKSRSQAELQRRADYLLRIIEKEIDHIDQNSSPSDTNQQDLMKSDTATSGNE